MIFFRKGAILDIPRASPAQHFHDMFGIIFISASTFFEEIASSFGKRTVAKKEQGIYTMGFVQMCFTTILLLCGIILWPESFTFSLASLPTFIPRVILEIIQATATVLAITRADRSTFGMIRVITIPLLLGIDTVLGYEIPPLQIAGMGVMIAALLIVFSYKGIKKTGMGYALFTAVNGAVSISLYKYDISHFNSVAGEQIIVFCALLLYFFFMARYVGKERPIAMLFRLPLFSQSCAQAVSGILDSFAYTFAAASVIVAAKRSSAVLWSIVSGRTYFKEKNLLMKLVLFIILAIGIALLTYEKTLTKIPLVVL